MSDDIQDKPLIKPEEFDLLDAEGKVKTFILSNFDAVTGRQIITQYPMTGLPKIGDYLENEKLMHKLMSYVAIVTADGRKLRLSTAALINNHVTDAEMLIKIEMKMMEKNCSFFRDGRSLDLLDTLAQIVARSFMDMLTPLSAQSLDQTKPPLTS